MPKLLVDRLAPDSIAEFRAAARIRNEDAWVLARSGRGLAAVYLWGYVAEMILKASWFSLIGFPERRAISPADLRSAVTLGRIQYGIQWPGAGRLHAVLNWADLLVQHRIALGRPYPSPRFRTQVLAHSQQLYTRWRETMRYKKNRAYPSEVRVVAQSSHWLLSNSLRL